MGRDARCWGRPRSPTVSIHAPRMGRDGGLQAFPRVGLCFNSRAPHGARHPSQQTVSGQVVFQFTRPAWGATRCRLDLLSFGLFQFTRPAWGATALALLKSLRTAFQFTRPAWGATSFFVPYTRPACFNSRAPHGARPQGWPRKSNRRKFQFTRPAWGATRLPQSASRSAVCFNSRAPHGARQSASVGKRQRPVSIHAPRMGRDGRVGLTRLQRLVSIHAPRVGRDTPSTREVVVSEFQFTRPAWGATPSTRAAISRPCFNSRAPRGARPLLTDLTAAR